MHTGTALAIDRLWHKRRAQAVGIGCRFYHHLKGEDVVCRRERFAVFKVDLVLCDRHLMVGSLNLKSHVLEGQANIAAAALTQIGRPHIKITRRVMSDGGGMAILVGVEQEEFALRPHVEAVSHVRRILDRFAQDVARVPFKRRAVRLVDVADQPGNLPVPGVPGQDDKGVQIRPEIHIGLLNTHKALDGRAVEHTLVIQCFFHLAGRNGHILQGAENVRKLQPDKFHVIFPDNPDDVLLGVFAQNHIPLKIKITRLFLFTEPPCPIFIWPHPAIQLLSLFYSICKVVSIIFIVMSPIHIYAQISGWNRSFSGETAVILQYSSSVPAKQSKNLIFSAIKS